MSFNKSSGYYFVIRFPDKTIEKFVHIFNKFPWDWNKKGLTQKFGDGKRFNDLNFAE